MDRRFPLLLCGEATRGDDAAAFAVLELLPRDVLELVDVVQAGQLDVLMLLDLPEGAPCLVVDAVAGLPPGELWIRPLAEVVARARARGDYGRRPEPRSSHELPIDQVLSLAATLRGAPPSGTFAGIGGISFEMGAPLTPAVSAALPAFAEAIAAEIRGLGRTEPRPLG